MPGSGLPVLPNLNGFSVHKKPVFATAVTTTMIGRETQFAQQAYPLWEFELTYEVLRTETNNAVVDPYFSPLTNYEGILTVFLATQAQAGRFLFDDLSDNSRTDQFLGIGDGSTTTFRILRDFGAAGFKLEEPIGEINQTRPIIVKTAGTPTSAYTIDSQGEYITFDSAVPNGDEITATFHFYYKCRFIEDSAKFDEFLYNRWENKSLKFRSVKSGPAFFGAIPVPPAPGWRIFELPVPAAHTFAYFQNYVNGYTISRDGNYAVATCQDATGVRGNGVWYDLRTRTVNVAQAPVNAMLHTAVAWSVTASDGTGANWTGWFLDPDTDKIRACVWALQIPNPMLSGDSATHNSVNMSISYDGSIGTGYIETVANGDQPRAAWWTLALNATPNTLVQIAPNTSSAASGIADDNDTLCGVDSGGGAARAVKWNIGAATETLLDLPMGATESTAEAISADGTVCVGSYVDGSANRIACYWTGTTITSLPNPPGSDGTVGEASGISLDKTVICGHSTDANGRYLPTLWTSGVVSVLPMLSSILPTDDSNVDGISGDGTVAVGYCMRGGFAIPVMWKYFP